MIRQNRGAEGVEGQGYGKGMSPPHPTRGPGRDLKLPERVRKRFFVHFEAKKPSKAPF